MDDVLAALPDKPIIAATALDDALVLGADDGVREIVADEHVHEYNPQLPWQHAPYRSFTSQPAWLRFSMRTQPILSCVADWQRSVVDFSRPTYPDMRADRRVGDDEPSDGGPRLPETALAQARIACASRDMRRRFGAAGPGRGYCDVRMQQTCVSNVWMP